MKGSSYRAEILEPYAEALMSLAKSGDLTEKLGDDMRSLLSLLQGSEDLRQFLSSPIAKDDQKKAVLRQIAGDSLHPYTVNFLMLLVDRRRIVVLDGICQQYLALLRELNQTVLAEVTSAVALTEAQQQSVKDKVTAMTGARQVELATSIDPELLGGVIIKVGSQVVDASLRGQLRRIGIRLSSAA